jgi:hypothetical protein
MFQLTPREFAGLTSQIAISKASRGGRRTPPHAFTEHGSVMAANILRSDRAVQMSVFVVRAFISMRRMFVHQEDLARKVADIEKKHASRLDVHETAITEVLQQIMQLLNPPREPEPSEPPKKKIGFLAEEPGSSYGRNKRR